MGNRYLQPKKLTVAKQAYGLRTLFPNSRCSTHRETLDWTGVISPTPLSDSYTINISYKKGWNPKTYVLNPKLAVVPGKKLPHVYNQEKQYLCLYYPRGGGEWNSSMSIAITIVPWASEWLFFYELWLATGEWIGGGIHIESQKKEPGKSS